MNGESIDIWLSITKNDLGIIFCSTLNLHTHIESVCCSVQGSGFFYSNVKELYADLITQNVVLFPVDTFLTGLCIRSMESVYDNWFLT